MKKYLTFEINGYGKELVQGSFSDEEIVLIENHISKNNQTLEEFIFEDINSIFSERNDYHECDDISHIYGANVDDSTILINRFKEDEMSFDSIWEIEEAGGTLEIDEINPFDGTKNIITSYLNQDGTIFSGKLELKGGDLFDISKLKIVVKDLSSSTPHDNEIITSIFYDNKKIDLSLDGTSCETYTSLLVKKITV